MAGRGIQIPIGATTAQLAKDMENVVRLVKAGSADAEKSWDQATDKMAAATAEMARQAREALGGLRNSTTSFAPGASGSRGPVAGLPQIPQPEVDQETAARIYKQAAAIDALRASMDPLFAATQRYEQIQEQLSLAVASGAIEQRQANAVLKLAEAQYKEAAAAARLLDTAQSGFAGRLQTARPQIQNAAFQIQDLAVQIAAGGSAATAAAQQLPQFLGGFGVWGAVIGAAAAVILPLAANILLTGEEAETAEERIEKLRDAINSYVDAAEAARAPTAELEETYGRMAGAAREALNAQADLERDNALRALAADADALAAALGVVEGQSRQTMQAVAAAGAARSGTAAPVIAYGNAIEDIADSFGISTEAAQDFYQALQRVMTAEGPEAQAQAAQEAHNQLKAAAEAAGGVNEETAKALESLNAMTLGAAEFVAEVESGTNILKEMQLAGSGIATVLAGVGDTIAGWLPTLREAAGLMAEAGDRSINAYQQYQQSRAAGVAAVSAANKDNLVAAVAEAASKAGLDPAIVLAVMGVESGWNPGAVGGAGGNYQGLIQFGPEERRTYDVSAESDIATQVVAAIKFLLDRGVRPGDEAARYYAAVLAGNANAVNAGDVNNGGRVANITDFVQGPDFQEWLERSQRELGTRGLGGSPLDEAGTAAQEALEADREAEQAATQAEREREAAAKKAADEAQRLLDIRSDLVAQSQQMTTDAAFEATLVGQSAEAQARLRAEYLLTQQAKAQGISLTETIAGSEETYGDMITRTAVAIGAATVAEQQRTAVMEASAARQEQLQGVISSVSGALTDGLMDAITGAESFGDAMRQAISSILADLARLIIQQTIYNALARAMGQPAGPSLMGSLFGGTAAEGGAFAGGGYTGHGAKHSVAGVVHRGEYVLPASSVRRIGIPALEMMRRGAVVRPGFAEGGYAGGLGSWLGTGQRGSMGAPAVSVNPTPVENYVLLGDAEIGKLLSSPAAQRNIIRFVEREGFQRG